MDKRYAKNGGPFANATSNVPDMFGPGFRRNWGVRRADPESPTHALLDAPPRSYMVLAAQRLASLIRIIRKKSKNEPINIVAHSQGCFVSLLAHAMLAREGAGIKADTLILNNWPYSVDQPVLERTQSGDDQQTIEAREATLINIIKEFITSNPAVEPAFAELRDKGAGIVGEKWRHDANKERDNRGKVYLYFSPDDLTVGLGNIQGIGWWGLYDGMLGRMGGRFLQRVFASPVGATNGAPQVGDAPHGINLSFKWNLASQMTFSRKRQINAEELPEPFQAELGPGQMLNSPIDA
ncbi:T6SS effector phospholipase Tle3 domain-containing protein, partial [Janthinobacterium agaricidamnosum]|uniref:T6SS effector phospholipase Tle3 domain-containing protein n=1 Tax=Janthinobacterium agaricidamnosum TaxID=55508 RepID=UPI003F760A3C